MLCLINSGEIEHGGKKKKLLRDFRKGEEISITKVMKKTLNPVWNQSYKLYTVCHFIYVFLYLNLL